MDLYSSNLIDHLNDILAKNGLEKGKLYLEITESAYTEDAEQIVAVVNDLRDEGFKIEMDDFGTGYSSLNMLADIPVDFLKSVGCQLIQGYYFSKPLPEDEFMKYIEDLSEKQAE